MTTLIVVLGFVLLVAAGLGVAFWRLLRPPDPNPRAEFLGLYRRAEATYQPLNRLFAAADFDFLASQAGFRLPMIRRLRRDRRHILWLYLRDLRADFRRVYATCRTLAPYSQDPDFPALILRQALRFESLLLTVKLRLALGWFLPVGLDTTELVTAFTRLEQASRACLAAIMPQPPPALAAHAARL